MGVVSAVHALMSARGSQSAIAWTISCVTFPYVAVPAYWLFGRNRFHGYVPARVTESEPPAAIVRQLRQAAAAEGRRAPPCPSRSCDLFERLAMMPFTRGNRVELLIDGEQSFDRMFQEIGQATEYILVQFYIVRDDRLGRRMADVLARKASEGVRVYFLFDRIGSYALSSRYVDALRSGGVNVRVFQAPRGIRTRFQINFRNHRKIVLVDGRWAATGGANLGAEYRGHSAKFGYWRDTMVAVSGPAVQHIQLSFVDDWFFLTREVPELRWRPGEAARDGCAMLVLPTGPADRLHTCSMMFTAAIHLAHARLWISSPYFVPDSEIVRALQLAALRGVDVRILLPNKPDHLVVYWASFAYLEELELCGVRFYRYTKGLLHEKAVLVDDDLVLIGSANTDNRSFYLNFELTLLIPDRAFAAETQAMLEADLAHSRQVGSREYKQRGSLFRIRARLSRLFAPVL